MGPNWLKLKQAQKEWLTFEPIDHLWTINRPFMDYSPLQDIPGDAPVSPVKSLTWNARNQQAARSLGLPQKRLHVMQAASSGFNDLLGGHGPAFVLGGLLEFAEKCFQVNGQSFTGTGLAARTGSRCACHVYLPSG